MTGNNNQIDGLCNHKNISINITGDDNYVKIADGIVFANKKSAIQITIQGNGHIVDISACKINRLLQLLLVPGGFMPRRIASGSAINIKSGCTFNGNVSLVAGECDSKILVGSDCLFSDVVANTTDSHCLYDLESGERINKPKNILIGNHCWLGKDVTLSKGANIADNTIVAQKSLVTHSFTESNIVIGGVPADVIRTQVGWDIDVDFSPDN